MTQLMQTPNSEKREWISPLTRKKIKRFTEIKRGYYAFWLFVVLLVVSATAELLVNSKALMVKYEGKLYFPTYGDVIGGDFFGLDYPYEANYRELKQVFADQNNGNWVLLPPVPYDAYEQDFIEGTYPPYAPSAERQHYLGTDSIGRDIVARLVYGFRIAIVFALFSLFICMGIGVSIGCAMGYFGKWVDLLGQRVIEILSVVPFLYVIMVFASIVKPGLFWLTVIYVMFGWMGITWYMRSMTYKEKSRDYVMSARAIGASHARIIFHHILPNTLVMVITVAPFFVVGSISVLTALDYLGFGLRPPTPSIGELLQQGKANLDSPWIVWSAILSVSTILVLIQFIGEAVREAFDPKRYTRYE
jgi:microcin C transport system permease protein